MNPVVLGPQASPTAACKLATWIRRGLAGTPAVPALTGLNRQKGSPYELPSVERQQL